MDNEITNQEVLRRIQLKKACLLADSSSKKSVTLAISSGTVQNIPTYLLVVHYRRENRRQVHTVLLFLFRHLANRLLYIISLVHHAAPLSIFHYAMETSWIMEAPGDGDTINRSHVEWTPAILSRHLANGCVLKCGCSSLMLFLNLSCLGTIICYMETFCLSPDLNKGIIRAIFISSGKIL